MLINQQFLVNVNENTVTDISAEDSSRVTRLEPRLMKLLLLLADNVGQLVTRERIVSDIWDNYGGGEEGLHQAISILRKVLGDRAKTLIKTVPTKGYILAADISHPLNVEQTSFPKKSIRRSVIYLAGGVVLLLLALIFFTSIFPSRQPSPPEPAGTVIDTGHPSVEQRYLQRDQNEKPVDTLGREKK